MNETDRQDPYQHLPAMLRRRLGVGVDELGQLGAAAAHMVPAWLREAEAENRLPVALSVVIAIALQFLLPRRYSLHPRELLPAVELALLIALTVVNPLRLQVEKLWLRYASIAMIALMTVANAVSAALLAHHLITGTAGENAAALLAAGGSIYATNIIAFGLWYWEFDRGGPFARRVARDPHPDFLFPQMTMPELAHEDWRPAFLDYLYVSFTNATAFSPTDTMPLSRWAKMLMGAQSCVSLITVALVVARAVNLLN